LAARHGSYLMFLPFCCRWHNSGQILGQTTSSPRRTESNVDLCPTMVLCPNGPLGSAAITPSQLVEVPIWIQKKTKYLCASLGSLNFRFVKINRKAVISYVIPPYRPSVSNNSDCIFLSPVF
jgi:hypothetical protein